MFHGRGGGCWLLGMFAVALGAGILITAIFPVGALLFLVAFVLIACGWKSPKALRGILRRLFGVKAGE